MYTKSMAYYDAIYSFKDYAGEAAKLQAVIGAYKRSAGHTLLDVACGTGQHLAHLQQEFDAAGLDINPELLAIARKRCPNLAFYEGDMVAFDLGRQFDVVTCLFSAIGAMMTVDRLNMAIAAMARHVAPGGVLVIEPWFAVADWHEGRPHITVVDEPELKIARLTVSELVYEGDQPISLNVMHYTVATPEGVQYFTEDLQMGLFDPDEYRAAFEAAGLNVIHDPDGLIGRGLYIGQQPGE